MWWRRRKALEDLQQDIRDHLDQETADNTARGMSPDEARRRAHVKFGNSTLAVEGTREVWVWRWLEQLRQDVRYGLRLLVRDRAFSTVAVLTLALGMGVSTALFSVIDAALLRPLPYPNPEQLVEISVQTRRADGRMSGGGAPSLLDVRAWRDAQHAVSHVGMGRLTGRPLIVEAGGEPERLRVATVTEDVFELFGVNPILGRGIHPGDTHEGAPAVAVLGHGYWQTRFGGTPGVLGRTIRIANLPAIVVGILPEGFYSDTMIWQAQQFPATWERRRGTGTPVYGRLLAGLTFEDAQRRLSDVIRASAGDDAESATASVQLESLYNAETAGYGSTMKILLLAVSIILVVACVNVAGLLLARGALRQSEMAVRASIGAGRLRLTRQLLAESLVLSCVGGGLGVALAWISLDALVALLPLSLPPNAPVAVNGTVLACAAGLSAGTALVVGLVPALRLSKVRIGEHLGAAGRRHGSALSRRGGQLLIAVEVALGVVLLASAGLLLRSLDRLMEVDLGIDPDSFVTMEVEPVDPAPTVRKQFYSALLEAIGALPDVAAVGAIDSLPLGGGFMRVTRATAGELDSGPANLRVLQVMPGYFEAVGLEASMGRLPTEAERAGRAAVLFRAFSGRAPVAHSRQRPTTPYHRRGPERLA
jgi:predicted permease